MREIGIMIFKMGLGLITIQMVISIKENGLMENRMEKATIFTMEIKEFLREIGRMGKNKVLVS